MNKSSLRTLGSQVGVALAGGVVAVALTGSGLAGAQNAPETGSGVAEAIAGPNTVNSAAIINGSIGRADLKAGVVPLWAHVDGGATVTKLAGKGVVSVVHQQDPGVYIVTFNQSVANCAWVATRTDNADGVAQPGFITAELQNAVSATSTVWVRTYDVDGAPANTPEDEGFTLAAIC